MGVVDQKDHYESEFQGFVLGRRRALMRTAYLLTGDPSALAAEIG